MNTVLTVILWVAGSGVALVVLWIAVVVVISLANLARGGPAHLKATASAPSITTVEEQFTVTVDARNEGSRPCLVKTIDVSEKYLRGIAIESIEPTPSDRTGGFGLHTVEFKRLLGPGEALRVVFTCRAVHAGDFAGDFDVWLGIGRFVSCPVRTVVRG